MPRILSLIPSSTEIVCALGFENQLIGRSHECYFPSSVQKLSSCTAPKFKVEGTSAEIDQRVKSILKNALSVYQIDEKKLQQMQPDIIITQAQCEVCAVSLKDVEKAVCEWVESRPQIVSLEPNKLSDIWKDFINIAEALGVKEQGHELVSQLKQRMNKIDGLVKSQRHQLHEKIGCSEHRVLKGTRVSNGLMTPKSDCILHPVDFLRVHHD